MIGFKQIINLSYQFRIESLFLIDEPPVETAILFVQLIYCLKKGSLVLIYVFWTP